MEVKIEKTPNPQSLKFSFGTKLIKESVEFKNPSEALISPLASKIFNFPWVDSIFLQEGAIIINKQDWVEWEILEEPLRSLIEDHLLSGEKLLHEREKKTHEEENSEESKEMRDIKKAFNEIIRPQVQVDGGDILFQKYEDFKVYVVMQGACKGCPSSQATLKEGVEVVLKRILPEIKEVIPV